KEKIKPGDLVICDQFVDKTNNRKSTYFDGPKIVHISAAEPYCPNLRKIAADTCRKLKIPCHKNGTVVVIEGPRFSTKAESNFYSRMDWDVINMTQCPEVILARELEMCYLNISLVTDYDAGLQGRPDIKPVNAQEVMEVFRNNNEKVKKIFLEIIKNLSKQRNCLCGQALKNAVL
ncbi:MAG: MTAP family purine nucleoside phosphorylase, partial [Patescibacteria group bacterium]